MHTVTATRTVDAPVPTVWKAIDDFGNVYRFHPDIEHSESIDDAATGEGAQRQCDFYDGGTIREEDVGQNGEPETADAPTAMAA